MVIKRCSKKYCRRKYLARGLCQKHYLQYWRARNPIKYAYNNIKNRANQRGRIFDLTINEFKEFCLKTGYISSKGITKDSMTIDRIDPSKGYTKDNIRAITKSENSWRHHHPEDDYIGPDTIEVPF